MRTTAQKAQPASHIKNERNGVLSGTRNGNCNTNIPSIRVITLSRAWVIIASNRNMLNKAQEARQNNYRGLFSRAD
jgi:hypothetical protein